MGSQRLAALDVFRGLTIAAMILVNNPGSWQYVYPPLRHAPWHGWTPTDLVFPFFLFIVGVSLALSLSARLEERSPRGEVVRKILKRASVIFALGIFLHLFPKFRPAGMRLPGVLQRIALCFLFAALLYLVRGRHVRLGVALGLLAGYWLALKFIPVPGYGPGVLTLEGNLPGYIDNHLLAGHLYKGGFDPEGLLSTLPALATTLLGTLAGDLLRANKTLVRKSAGLLGYGLVLTAAGLLLHPLFPINKQLWTSSYVLFTAGAALLFLGLLLLLVELFRLRIWAYPFFVLGTNAIAVFVLSTLMTKTLIWIKVTSGGTRQTLYTWLYEKLFASWAGPDLGSLAFALVYVLLWVLLMNPLYRRKIFLKV